MHLWVKFEILTFCLLLDYWKCVKKLRIFSSSRFFFPEEEKRKGAKKFFFSNSYNENFWISQFCLCWAFSMLRAAFSHPTPPSSRLTLGDARKLFSSSYIASRQHSASRKKSIRKQPHSRSFSQRTKKKKVHSSSFSVFPVAQAHSGRQESALTSQRKKKRLKRASFLLFGPLEKFCSCNKQFHHKFMRCRWKIFFLKEKLIQENKFNNFTIAFEEVSRSTPAHIAPEQLWQFIISNIFLHNSRVWGILEWNVGASRLTAL